MERVSGSLWKSQPLESGQATSQPPRLGPCDYPTPTEVPSRVIPGLDDADALREQGWDFDSNATRLCHVRVRQVLILDIIDGDMDRKYARQECSLECLYTTPTPAPVLCPEQQFWQDDDSSGGLPGLGVSASGGDTFQSESQGDQTVQGTGRDDEQYCNRGMAVPTLTVEGWVDFPPLAPEAGGVPLSDEEADVCTREPVMGSPDPLGPVLRIMHGDRTGPARWDALEEFEAEVSLKEGEVIVGVEGGGEWNIFDWGCGVVGGHRPDLHLHWVTFTVLDTATGSSTTVSSPPTKREKAKSAFCFKAPPGHYIAGFHGTEWFQEFPWTSLGLYLKSIPMYPDPSYDVVPNPELFYPVGFLRDFRRFQRLRVPLAPDIAAIIFTKLLELHLLEASPRVTFDLPDDSDYVEFWSRWEAEQKREQQGTRRSRAKAKGRKPKKVGKQ